MRTLLMLFLVLSLAACGGNGGDDTEDAVSSADVELSETATLDDTNGTVTVSYPEGWVVREDGVISFADATATFDLMLDSAVLESGQFFVNVLPLSSQMIELFEIAPDASPAALLEAILAAGQLGSDEESLPDIQAFTAAGREGAYVTESTIQDGEPMDGLAVAVDEGDSIVVLELVTRSGESEQFLPTLQAMAATVEFEPVEDTE